MTPAGMLSRMVEALEHAGIAYMVTGSFASSFHGQARSTQDIDIVISATADQLRALVAQFQSDDYYADIESALSALEHRSMFNIVELSSGWKVDLIMRKNRPFSLEEFSRRISIELPGTRMFLVSAEDLIIAKLEWAKEGTSLRQIEDVAGIIKTRRTKLDIGYIERWIGELSLEHEWIAASELAER